MKYRLLPLLIVLLLLLAASCSGPERMLIGKWSLAGRMIGGAPSSFWFKRNGVVLAPWEKRSYAMLSEGTYEFTDDTHIRIVIDQGHYKGNVYQFQIIKLTENELVLGSDFEEIRLKRVSD
ncbi:MAG: lipocalin family protein [Nitrospiraceae bacterium]|nr:MAG: lipocalin family protein [Nitrospiraceae bacterium]